MKLLPVIEVLVVNAALIPLLVVITENYGLRDAFWHPEGFVPTTVRYPFFYITSAVSGSTTIPGLLTVDWQQIVLLIMVVTDAVFAWSVLRARRNSRGLDASPALQ